MDEAQIESIVDELKYFVYIDEEDKTNKEIILEHFDEVLEYCDRYIVSEFLVKEAVYDPAFDDYITENFTKLVSYIPTYNIDKFLGTITEFNPNVILQNMDEIISEDNIHNFWSIFISIKGRNEDVDRQLNQKLKSGSNYFERALIYQYLDKQRIQNFNGAVLPSPSEKDWGKVPDFEKSADEEKTADEEKSADKEKSTDEESVFDQKNVNNKEINIYAKTLSYVIRETLDETHTDYTDIKYIDEGVFSQVYQIGNKVLKVGSELHKYNIPNHRRLLQPLIRANYTLGNGKVFSSFQLLPLGDTYFSKEEKTDDKLYEIYKECRKDGIVLLDIKWENVCKLLSDNVTTWKGKKVNISPASVGLEGEMKGTPLKKGDIVYSDLDFVYKENDPSIPWIKMSDECKVFEDRYQKELEKATMEIDDR